MHFYSKQANFIAHLHIFSAKLYNMYNIAKKPYSAKFLSKAIDIAPSEPFVPLISIFATCLR